MESSPGCSSVIRILLRRSEAPSPGPQGILRPFNTGKGKKGRNCVWEGGGQGGERIHQNPPPPPPAGGRLQESGQRKGMGGGGRMWSLSLVQRRFQFFLHAAETS